MSAKKIAYHGLLTSIMLVLGLVERQFLLVPGIPGIRLGLSNTVLLYALCLMGAKSAWILMGLKVLLGGLLYAGASGMFYSFAGGVLSMAAMLSALRVRGVGLVGVSVTGAAMHMAGQILMSRLLLGSWAAALQAPLLMAAAVFTGVLTGVTAHTACQAIAGGNPEMLRRLQALDLAGRKKR
ncbi:MAG: Gx transporter family protein [Firmicutes bacterium]|nr:Gx transporter family protein [Bacillota bacterium]